MRRDNQPVFGSIPGVVEGAWFRTRDELMAAGVHGHRQFGIAWAAGGGPAESIVLSGGYEDDEDHGKTIVYTGMGGQSDGRQSADQTLTLGNLALMRAFEVSAPVRVIRGYRHRSPWSPLEGYRYAGVYHLQDAFFAPGREGFRVWRFVLERDPERLVAPMLTTAQLELIQLYQGCCQVCGRVTRLRTGPSAIAWHFVPRFRPHAGPDEIGNMLCVCPLHARELSSGAVVVRRDLTLLDEVGRLHVHNDHVLDPAAIRYRAERYGFQSK